MKSPFNKEVRAQNCLYSDGRPEAADNPNQKERDLAWGREHEDDLNDPLVPAEVEGVDTKVLG